MTHKTHATPVSINPQDGRYPSWVASNRLFQLFPRLHALEGCRDLRVVLAYTLVSGLFRNPFVASRILHAFCITCSGYARTVFDHLEKPNLFSWNTLIRCEGAPGAYHLFDEMRHRGVMPDNHTFTFLMKACRRGRAVSVGRQVHGYAVVYGFVDDPFVRTELVGFYLACGRLLDARLAFDGMVSRDVVSWTGMVSGLNEQGYHQEALRVFADMRRGDADAYPNVATLVSVLTSCAELGSLDHAMALHAYVNKAGLTEELFICNSLIDVYAKCGNCSYALEVFGIMKRRDLLSWTSVIMGLALYGLGEQALAVFSKMKVEGVVPDSITFVAVLSACSHAGLVEEGRKQFKSMMMDYNIMPEMKHYGCMVDLLGRAGLLYDAYRFILEMPLEPNLEILGSLLSSCRIANDLELGKIISARIASVCTYKGGSNVLLSNIYAIEKKWCDVMNIREGTRELGGKPPGRSWIEVNGVVHEFFVEDHLASPRLISVLESFTKIAFIQASIINS